MSLVPAAALVALGLVFLAERGRGVASELAAESRTRATRAAQRVERDIRAETERLAARLRDPPLSPRASASGWLRFDLRRAPGQGPDARSGSKGVWALAGGPPATVELPETSRPTPAGKENETALDPELFLPALVRLELQGEGSLEAARRYELLARVSRGVAPKARLQVARAAALRRAGELREAEEEIESLLETLPASASTDGIPLHLSLRLEQIEIALEAGKTEESSGFARALVADLSRDTLALPTGRSVAHIRAALEALGRLELPGLSIPPEPPGALAPDVLRQRELSERLAVEIEEFEPDRDLAEVIDKPGLILVARTDRDGLRCAAAALSLEALETRLREGKATDRFALSIDRQGSIADRQDKATRPGESIALAPPLQALSIRVCASPEEAGARLRPWRTGIALGIAGIILASLIAAISSARSVRRQIDTAAFRSELVASISHDLRTPLTAMLLQLEMAEDQRLDEKSRRDQIAHARQSGRRLQHLVERVLDFTRAGSAGDTESTLEDPADLARAAAAELEPLLSRRSLTLDAGAGTPRIRVEREALIQVLVSLIENVLRHTPPEVPIRLAVEEHGSEVGLVVEDRGPGVPAAERARLTEPFYRGSSARAREGAGLGLAMARRFVERNGGRLVITAMAPGARNEGLRVAALFPHARRHEDER